MTVMNTLLKQQKQCLKQKKDSILKKILADLYDQRKDYKKTSYTYYEKAHEIEKKFKL